MLILATSPVFWETCCHFRNKFTSPWLLLESRILGGEWQAWAVPSGEIWASFSVSRCRQTAWRLTQKILARGLPHKEGFHQATALLEHSRSPLHTGQIPSSLGKAEPSFPAHGSLTPGVLKHRQLQSSVRPSLSLHFREASSHAKEIHL